MNVVDDFVRAVVRAVGSSNQRNIYRGGWGPYSILQGASAVQQAWASSAEAENAWKGESALPLVAIEGARVAGRVMKPSSGSRRVNASANTRFGAGGWKTGHLDWRPVGPSVFETAFISPLHSLLPEESRVARARLVLPPLAGPAVSSVAVLLPPTGSHSYLLRDQWLARPLAQRGVASLMLMLPFFGDRRPSYQLRSALTHVSDLFTMGAACTAELDVLLASLSRWLQPEAVTLFGVSVGGYMASVSASLLRRPNTGLVSVCSPKSASSVYVNGILSESVAFDQLARVRADPLPLLDSLGIPLSLADADGLLGQTGDALSDVVWAQRMLSLVLEQVTNLERYPPVQGPASVYLAKHDQYIAPRDQTGSLQGKWPLAQVEHLPSSHCTALFFRNLLINAVSSQLSQLSQRLDNANINK